MKAQQESQAMIEQARKEAAEEAKKILDQAEKETAELRSNASSKMDQARNTIVKQLIG
jgi:V/A-type H+-transporting ATPase subunit G/H